MYYVYFLRSLKHVNRAYIGMPDPVADRLRKHNSGTGPRAAKWRPWEPVGNIRVRQGLSHHYQPWRQG